MQLIESALAFAITMLVLSLIVSSLVELIHRVFSMREAGLKYVLGRMFDQVLKPYLPAGKYTSEQLETLRQSFVDRMSANRAPMGVEPKPTPDKPSDATTTALGWSPRLWSGRDLTSLTTKDFMERLGTIDTADLGKALKDANDKANAIAQQAGQLAGDAADAVLKDVAQKFEALGDDATDYFAGRAKLLSVLVAIGLAFAAHVDAVDLFRTYLNDPNARQKVIEQTQSVTAQYKAAEEAAKALKEVAATPAANAPDVKTQIDNLTKDWKAAIGNVDSTVKQYQGLGVPIGWTADRIKAADMSQWVWTCPPAAKNGWQTPWGSCPEEKRNVWFQVPTVLSVYVFLVLGGLLIGLGSPFWYNAVTGLTNIRNVARDVTGASAAQTRALQGSNLPVQPLTPSGVFAASAVAQVAKPAGNIPPSITAPKPPPPPPAQN